MLFFLRGHLTNGRGCNKMGIRDEIDFNPVFFHSVSLPQGAFMKNFLPLVLLLSATFAFAEEIKINYDEALVPEYTLPDPLT